MDKQIIKNKIYVYLYKILFWHSGYVNKDYIVLGKRFKSLHPDRVKFFYTLYRNLHLYEQ